MQHKLSIQFERVECRVYDKEIVKSFKCSLLRDDATNELLLNSDLILAKEVHDIKLRFKLIYDIKGKKVNFPNVEADICDALTQRFDFSVLRMAADETIKRSNIPLKCPLKSVSMKCSFQLMYRHLLKTQQFLFFAEFFISYAKFHN